MSLREVQLIGASFGWGAGHKEVQEGPPILASSVLRNQKWHGMLCATLPYHTGKNISYDQRLMQVADFTQRLSKDIVAATGSYFPLVLGGDHSIAIGTWTGHVVAQKAQSHFGLIWIDAHMDSHTPSTTPSQNIHGMPLAALMGFGEPSLVNLIENGAKLNPSHVVLIGVRSFEPGEAELLDKLNVRIYFMDEVRTRGFKAVFEEASAYVAQNTKAFGVSIDIDAFDPTIAPGTGTPEANGIIEIDDVYRCLKEIKANSKLVGVEIVEFDPTRDVDQKTANLVKNLVTSLL